MNTTNNARRNALRALEHVICHNRTIDWVLANSNLMAEPFSQELVYGVLRHYFSLKASIDQHLKAPLRSKDEDLFCVMLVGAYQLYFTRVPSHAAINESVELARALRKPWAKGLLNAVLRKLSRTKRTFGNAPSLPPWMAGRVPRKLADAFAQRAPMTVRINPERGSIAEFRGALAEAEIEFDDTPLEEAVVLHAPATPSHAPGLG